MNVTENEEDVLLLLRKMVQSRNCWTEEYKEMQRSIFFFLERQPWTEDSNSRTYGEPEDEQQQQQKQQNEEKNEKEEEG
ncbi:hypothetical protein M513_13986, partial [Trichuris suis]